MAHLWTVCLIGKYLGRTMCFRSVLGSIQNINSPILPMSHQHTILKPKLYFQSTTIKAQMHLVVLLLLCKFGRQGIVENFTNQIYSKASRYTALRSADLRDTRFLIGSQNTWDTRFWAKSLEDALFFSKNSVTSRLQCISRLLLPYCLPYIVAGAPQ